MERPRARSRSDSFANSREDLTENPHYEYLSPVTDDLLLCSLCRLPMIDPVSTSCEHPYCTHCVRKLKACTVCGEEVDTVHEEKLMKRSLNNLGKRGESEQHLDTSCPWFLCPHLRKGCAWRGKRKQVGPHTENDCQHVPIQCQFQASGCTWSGVRKELQGHALQCPVKIRLEQEEREKEVQRRREEYRKKIQSYTSELEKRRQLVISKVNSTDQITLNVGGTRMQFPLPVLCCEPGSILAQMFTSIDNLHRDPEGAVVLNRHPEVFRAMVTFLQSHQITMLAWSPSLEFVTLAIESELKFWGMQSKLVEFRVAAQFFLRNLNRQTNTLRQVPDFQVLADVSAFDFEASDLSHCNLSRFDLLGVDFRNADLEGLDLSDANIAFANFGQLEDELASPRNQPERKKINTKSKMKGINLSGVDLTGMNLTATDLSNSNFSNTNLSNANLANSNLQNCNLKGSKMSGSNLFGANLMGVELFGADLSNVKHANIFESKIENENQHLLSEWVGHKRFKLIYRGSRNGFEAKDFHTKCDGKGATVTLIRDTKGNVFGGFTSISWSSPTRTRFQSDPLAFLFSLKDSQGVAPRRFKVTNPGQAVEHRDDWGPIFGNDHIGINPSPEQHNNNWSEPFSNYENDTGKEYPLTGENRFTVADYEVFQIL